jgi:hypothetical protein
MPEAPNSKHAVRTTLLYALCGPLIGALGGSAFSLARSEMMGSQGGLRPLPFSSSVSSLILTETVSFAYLYGLLPALATGAVVARLSEGLVRWDRKPLICGLIGAATSAAFLAISILRSSSSATAGDMAGPFFFFSFMGFVATFCCSWISLRLERKLESRNLVSSVGKEPTL